ncbi:tetratricopeptide repeat protein [candidate division WOR-3 bacterium]|nr:tetratricopeptide repeat protein [candidate division WOR-3 bacterium]
MARGKLKPGFLITGGIIGLIIAVVLPLLLGGSWFWILCPILGVLLFTGVLFANRWLLTAAACLLVVGLVVIGLWTRVPVSNKESEDLKAVGSFINAEVQHLRMEYEKSLESYTLAIRLGLYHPWIEFQRARTYGYLGQEGEAFEGLFYMMKAPSKDFPLELLYSDYAVAAFNIGENDVGVRALNESINLNFRPASSYFKLGTFYKSQGKLLEADSAFQKAYRLGYEKSECSCKLAEIAFDLKEYGEAERLYKRAIREDLENTSAYNSFGMRLALQGRFSEAEDILKKGELIMLTAELKYDPILHTEILTNLAYVLAEKGDYEEAFQTYERIATEIPRGPDVKNPFVIFAYENWADLYLRLNQPALAYAKMKDAATVALTMNDTLNYYRIQRRLRAFSEPSSTSITPQP